MTNESPVGSLGSVEALPNQAEVKLALVLALDTSGSMSGQPIAELNKGLAMLKSELMNNEETRTRVEIAVVTFGGDVRIIRGDSGSYERFSGDPVKSFVSVEQFKPVALSAGGETPMGEAVRQSLELIRRKKVEDYKPNGVFYYRPWLFLFTDGEPTDDWEVMADFARQEAQGGHVTVFPVGFGQFNEQKLKRFGWSEQHPQGLVFVVKDSTAFRDMFVWLGKSASVAAGGAPGEQKALPPTGPSIEIRL